MELGDPNRIGSERERERWVATSLLFFSLPIGQIFLNYKLIIKMYFLYLGWVHVGEYISHPCLEPSVRFENKTGHPHFILLLGWGGQKLSSLT